MRQEVTPVWCSTGLGEWLGSSCVARLSQANGPIVLHLANTELTSSPFWYIFLCIFTVKLVCYILV